jgi:hypothetical protein
LTVQKLLAQEGVHADLRIGVLRSEDGLCAHAWLEYLGQPVGERVDIADTFAVLKTPERQLIEVGQGASVTNLPMKSRGHD